MSVHVILLVFGGLVVVGKALSLAVFLLSEPITKAAPARCYSPAEFE